MSKETAGEQLTVLEMLGIKSNFFSKDGLAVLLQNPIPSKKLRFQVLKELK